MAYIISIYSLSLIVEVSHFPMLGKNFHRSNLVIIRECPQNNVIHILRYFKNSPLIPFHLFRPPSLHPSTHLFLKTPLIKDKWGTEFLCKNSSPDSLSYLLVSIYVFFTYTKNASF